LYVARPHERDSPPTYKLVVASKIPNLTKKLS